MRDYLTIVTGVPRSGTSLVMQMLAAGGLPVLTDGQRTPDDDNPHGYFEFERVKQLRTDQAWLADAGGQVVKIIYRLLYDLPPAGRYRLIFVRRDLREVAASQQAMLARMGKPAGPRSDAEMIGLFAAELAQFEGWLAAHPQWPVLEVEHRQLLTNPAVEAARLAEFLGDGAGTGLHVPAMVQAVDAGLYRQRRG